MVNLLNAIEVLRYSPRYDINLDENINGDFVQNFVEYSERAAELKKKYQVEVPKSALFYSKPIDFIQMRNIVTDQKLVRFDKVMDRVENHSSNAPGKPITVALFEELNQYLVLDGNHRLNAEILVRGSGDWIEARVVDVRSSFFGGPHPS